MRSRLALPVAEMAARYVAGESTYDLGRAYGVDHKTVWSRLVGAGVKTRKPGGAQKRGGPLASNGCGYLQTYDREGRRVSVHRACWEAHHGLIPTGCVVHHISGDPLDNRIENLVCMANAEHVSLHRRRSIANARG